MSENIIVYIHFKWNEEQLFKIYKYLQVCYPTVDKSTVSSLLQMVPSGQFDRDQRHFVYPNLPHFFVAKWLTNNVADLKVFSKSFACKKLGNVDLCPEFFAQEHCALEMKKRKGCVYNSVEGDKSVSKSYINKWNAQNAK